MVIDAFQNGNLSSLKGIAAIGHTRYSTAGGDSEANIQPLAMQSRLGWVSLAHNGNLVNASQLTECLEGQGSIFQTTTDTEVFLHLIAKCKDRNLADAIICAAEQVKGAYSLLVMNHEYLIALRDPYGFRPLIYGNRYGSPVFASESCAFDLMEAEVDREVLPGEMIIVEIATNRVTSKKFIEPQKPHQCVFELIYFSRPDSNIFGTHVYDVRKLLGRRLAQEQPAQADIVIPVPDSGIAAAIGYAEHLNLPFQMGLIRSHYGRTFIQPSQDLRNLGVRLKLNVVRSCVEGKRVVVVDDSLVRGTTSRKIIRMLKESGAKEVHLRISSPPTVSPCYYGIDTPTRDELIASKHNVQDICRFIEADSLGYLSQDGLSEITGSGFCNSCFSNHYPIPYGGENKSADCNT